MLVGTFFIAAAGPVGIGLALGSAALVYLIAAAARRPAFAVLGIVVWVPLQIPVLAFLYKLGMPAVVARELGYLKEFWAIALAVAAWRATRSQRIRADLLDWLGGLYIGIATLYLVVPFADSSTLGGVPFAGRLNAWRLVCLYVVIFLSVRRLRFQPSVIRHLRVGLFIVAAVLAGFSAWEIANNAGFNNFLTNTLDYPKFKAAVFHITLQKDLLVRGTLGNSTFVRSGSLLNDPLSFGFLMVIPFGIALERVAARKDVALGMAAAVAGLLGVIFSGTRGAALGVGVVLLLALAFGPSRIAPHRLRLLLAVIVGLVVLLPFAGQSTLVARMESLAKPASQTHDNEVHVDRTRAGLTAMIDHPLGRGLGANSQTGFRYGAATAITTEDSYLETGNELGVPALLVLVAFLGAVLVRLRQRAMRGVEHAGLAGGAWLAGCGLVVGAFTLQVWYELTVTLVFWTVAGLALADFSQDPRPRRHDADFGARVTRRP